MLQTCREIQTRLISLKLEIKGVTLTVTSEFGLQAGCQLKREEFWNKMDEVVDWSRL